MRTYNEEIKFLEKISPMCWKVNKGFVDNMKVGNDWFLFSS